MLKNIDNRLKLLEEKEKKTINKDSKSRIDMVEEKMNIFDNHHKKFYYENALNKFDLTINEANQLKSYNDIITNLEQKYTNLNTKVRLNTDSLNDINNIIKDTVNEMFRDSNRGSNNKLYNPYFDEIKANKIIFNSLSLEDISNKCNF